MNRTLFIRNRRRKIPVNTTCLRALTRALLTELLRKEDFDLGIYLVGAPEITRLNQSFLQHRGPTDVITFDYASGVPPSGRAREAPAKSRHNAARRKAELRTLHGEIFICLDEALAQARRFRVSWQSELVRYVIHGVLHLDGHDDRHPASRRRMKRAESRLLREIARRFPLRKIRSAPRLPP